MTTGFLEYGENPVYQTARRDLERRLRMFVARGAGLDSSLCIPSYGDGPAPASLYASVGLIQDKQIGTPMEFRRPNGELLQRSSQDALYSVQFYRAGGHEAARRFVQWAASPFGSMASSEYGFRVSECRPEREVSAIVARTWEERIGLELRIAYFAEAVYEAGEIQSVQIAVNDEPGISVSATP